MPYVYRNSKCNKPCGMSVEPKEGYFDYFLPLCFYYHAIKFKVCLIAPLTICRIVKLLLKLCKL